MGLFDIFRKGRAKSKSGRNYQGAQISRKTADWVTSGATIDATLRTSLARLRNRSRQLARDSDHVRQYLRAVENNVIGQGITFQSQVRMERGQKLNEKVNLMIEQAWHKWSDKNNCHAAGKLCFSDIERLAVRAVAESGDVFIRVLNRRFGNSNIPFGLQIIEADQLDEDKNGVNPDGSQIRMGIELDNYGRPVAYHFKADHPGDYQFSARRGSAIRVPANEVIHLFKTERPGQTRGVPWLASSILTLHQLEGYQEAAVIQARIAASTMGFITSEQGEITSDDVQDGEKVQDFDSGVFRYLAPGESVSVPNLDQNSKADYASFIRDNLRKLAAGGGISYETLSRDYSTSNYSSSRLALLDDRDHWRALQYWMIENFHKPIFEKWLEVAVLSGELNLPDYEINPEKYNGVRWMPRGWGWVDPAKEIEAAVEAIKNNLTTASDVLAQQGLDFEEVVMQRKREIDILKSAGLYIEPEKPAAQDPANPDPQK